MKNRSHKGHSNFSSYESYLNHHQNVTFLSVYLFVSYQRPCSAHAGHIGTDRSLLTGLHALLLWQTWLLRFRDFSSSYFLKTHVAICLPGSCRVRTWTAHLTDGDAHQYVILQPLHSVGQYHDYLLISWVMGVIHRSSKLRKTEVIVFGILPV